MDTLYKIMAKVGTFQNQAGHQKNQYKELGKVCKNDKGSFILLDSLCLNPSLLILMGYDVGPNVLLSLFSPDKPQEFEQKSTSRVERPSKPKLNANTEFDDEIPF